MADEPLETTFAGDPLGQQAVDDLVESYIQALAVSHFKFAAEHDVLPIPDWETVEPVARRIAQDCGANYIRQIDRAMELALPIAELLGDRDAAYSGVASGLMMEHIGSIYHTAVVALGLHRCHPAAGREEIIDRITNDILRDYGTEESRLRSWALREAMRSEGGFQA
jgi:hypothetical protein